MTVMISKPMKKSSRSHQMMEQVRGVTWIFSFSLYLSVIPVVFEFREALESFEAFDNLDIFDSLDT